MIVGKLLFTHLNGLYFFRQNKKENDISFSNDALQYYEFFFIKQSKFDFRKNGFIWGKRRRKKTI